MRAGARDWSLGAYAAWSDIDLGITDVFASQNDLEDRTLALFGEVTQRLGRRVKVTLGLRAERIDKEAARTLHVLPGVTQRVEADRTFSLLSPKLAASWQVSDDALLYASTALSHRAGGYSFFNLNPALDLGVIGEPRTVGVMATVRF
jgi:outer membrane receptor protein involved in Fe transport